MKQKMMILMLMVAAVFSGHARQLTQIAAQADLLGGKPVEHGGGGGTCD